MLDSSVGAAVLTVIDQGKLQITKIFQIKSENLCNESESEENVDMRIKKTSCLKFTILTGFVIFVVINIKGTDNNENPSQVREKERKE